MKLIFTKSLFLCFFLLLSGSMVANGPTQFDRESGINNKTIQKATVKLYPNPAIEYLKIEFDREVQVSVSVINIIGRSVYDQKGTFTELVIPVTKFPPGAYFVTMRAGDEMIVRKIEVSE